MTPQDELKQKAAFFAAGFVESGMVVGLGTGSTTQFALERLGELIRSGRLVDGNEHRAVVVLGRSVLDGGHRVDVRVVP